MSRERFVVAFASILAILLAAIPGSGGDPTTTRATLHGSYPTLRSRAFPRFDERYEFAPLEAEYVAAIEEASRSAAQDDAVFVMRTLALLEERFAGVIVGDRLDPGAARIAPLLDAEDELVTALRTAAIGRASFRSVTWDHADACFPDYFVRGYAIGALVDGRFTGLYREESLHLRPQGREITVAHGCLEAMTANATGISITGRPFPKDVASIDRSRPWQETCALPRSRASRRAPAVAMRLGLDDWYVLRLHGAPRD